MNIKLDLSSVEERGEGRGFGEADSRRERVSLSNDWMSFISNSVDSAVAKVFVRLTRAKSSRTFFSASSTSVDGVEFVS